MDSIPPSELQVCIDRVLKGDAAAKGPLISHAYERLRRLARKILHESFPRLRNVHSTGTVLDEAVIRLLDALKGLEVKTERDFYRLSAVLIRRTLVDLARKHDRRREKEVPMQAAVDDTSLKGQRREPEAPPDDRENHAMRKELHEFVDMLPEKLREVVDLLWTQGLTQIQAAEILGVSQPMVSRLWNRALSTLADHLADFQL